ncbi:hypothetical protein HanIR_Chr08g0380131 [Helianthus annuus]|nr:hypothetical protein HanIR_Chr08g0380131 [Helianthus annuus]
MIIKKETTISGRRHHPSPPKGSSLSFEKNQDLFNNYAFSVPARMITRTNKMATKVMVRRALTPPARRLSWRWFDFRPTPSRLSVMSMAI